MDEQAEGETLNAIYGLSDENQNWSRLLALGTSLDKELKRKLLWTWPTALDLINLITILNTLDIRCVLSIGCGCGLLEWLLHSAAEGKLAIYGLERDPNWWHSKYAVRSFIPLHYIEDAEHRLTADFLRSCCSGSVPSALLFCYFNNRIAFLDYLRVFEGKWLILIGPLPGLGIHTDPNPLQPQLSDKQWTLREVINWTEQNVIAIYKKRN